MDPHSFIARAEAQRWIGIAEKLLLSNDFVGSKTFAIRARESDPRLEAADQILAIADTLLAAEKRVVVNNGVHKPDFYAILQLVQFVQDTDHIAAQYRRLAVALNPHQNRFPYSEQAFQVVNDAWAVLSNPMRKSMYDSDLDYPQQQQMNNLGFNLEQQHHQQQQPHNFFSINQELPEQQQSFQSRLHQSHQHQQLQQHNFLSQPNPVRPLPVREQEHMFQHREQEQLFQPQVQPFQVTSPPHQQTRMSPQPQQHIQSPPATPQSPFSWPQTSQMSQPQQQIQHQHQHQVKQEQQHLQQVKQEHHMKHEQQLQQQLKKQQQLQQEQLNQQQLEQMKQQQLKQQQLQEEQRKQQQLLEEQRKQQQLMEEQRKQQQLQEEQRKQQQLLEEQRKQQQLLEEQRKQQQLLEEQRKQQQLLEEQRKQQQLLDEQRKQQQLLEEQRKQQQLQEEQRKQQQLQEEQRKQQQLIEEQRKQQQLQEQQKQQQLLEEQRKQQQLQEEQRKQQQLQQEQQQHEFIRQNAAPVQLPNQVNSNNGVREEEPETEAETEAVDDSPTFWTACPYCFYMYEYPKVYVECTLRCDNCKRAFQAVRISSPPPIIEGQDAYFYCWGFIPVGLSMSPLQKSNNKGKNSNWTPFSSLHNASNNVQNHLNEQAAPKENLFVNKSSGPRIYIDDITEDVFIGVSEPNSDSDTEWVSTKKQKSKRMDKGFKERIQVLALRAVYTKNGSVKNLKQGIPLQKGVEVPTMLVVETSKINVGSNPRKQSGRVAQDMGKLDLNVEFNNNDGEETGPRMTAGTRVHKHGEEDDIEEGIEFFEGLDEYLSSLPILSVVNEEKVKAA